MKISAFNLRSTIELSWIEWFKLKFRPMRISRDEYSGLILYFKELNGRFYLIKSAEPGAEKVEG